MQFRELFKRGQVKPEAVREGPLCMDTWRCVACRLNLKPKDVLLHSVSLRWMFDCCRVPGPEGVDWSVSYAKEGDVGESGHIVVFRKGRVWKLEPWQDGHLLSVEEIEK